MKEAWLIDHSAIRWPWLDWPDSAGHDEALRQDWRRIRTIEGRALLFCLSVCWPAVAAVHAARALRAHGRTVSASYGIGLVRQASQLIGLATRYNCPPASYYKFRLFLAADPGTLSHQYVHHYQICNLLGRLNDGAPVERLNDKVEFSVLAAAGGLKVASALVAFKDGRPEHWYVESRRLPLQDLVLKARDLSCGAWFESWEYLGQRRWRRGGRVADESDLLAYAGERSRDHGVFLQIRLTNHRDLRELAGRGLSTLRLVTHRESSGAATVVIGAFRMPCGDSMVDNFAAGGIAAPVDLEGGTLGIAVAKLISRGEFTHHPDTGRPIDGVQLPFWKECLALVRAAHAALAEIPFVGWDVVIAPAGPLLLEANTTWCADLVQMPNRRPLGDVVFRHFARERSRRPRPVSEGTHRASDDAA